MASFLFSRRKITILKAIHNWRKPFAIYYILFSRRKITILKAIHNDRALFCYDRFLFSRRKITILKAIHNNSDCLFPTDNPVFAPKNYNFESNSQLRCIAPLFPFSCFRAEKLQF